MPEQFPNVVAAAPKLSRDEQFFETAVETILDAVERMVASRQQH